MTCRLEAVQHIEADLEGDGAGEVGDEGHEQVVQDLHPQGAAHAYAL